MIFAASPAVIDTIKISNYQGDLHNMPSGEYYVEIIDSVGCMTLDTFNIIEPSPILIDTIVVVPIHEFNGTNGYINIELSGGTPPYNYIWKKNNIIVSQEMDLTGLEEGKYILQVIDAFGCIFISDPIEVGIKTYTSEIENTSINVFPNPALDIINIELEEDSKSIKELLIYDAKGQIQYQHFEDFTTIQISTSHFPAGLFYVKVKVGQKVYIEKLIIL